jgi:hypothetical protein
MVFWAVILLTLFSPFYPEALENHFILARGGGKCILRRSQPSHLKINL